MQVNSKLSRTMMLFVLMCSVSTAALADRTLDNDLSTVSFVTIKKKDAAEVNMFREIKGQLSDSGQLEIVLDLNSVDTNIEIRDQRMREVLFNTVNFPDAILTAQVDAKAIEALQPGDAKKFTVPAKLSLHGETQPLTVEVLVSRAGDKLVVSSVLPVIVDAGKFSLAEGVEKLREIASLPAISHAVPVSFTLVLQ